MSAFMYIIPWLDTVGLGREIYHRFPMFIYFYTATGNYLLIIFSIYIQIKIIAPFVGIYYCSQFAPLVIFFLMFLAIVKNEKLAHFVRFNCMQVINLIFNFVNNFEWNRQLCWILL